MNSPEYLAAVKRIESLFDEPQRGTLIENLAPCLAGTINPAENIAIGKSKLGGAPDLPPGMAYPTPDSEHCEFFMQINFEEVSKFDDNNILPSSGLLSIFCQFYMDKQEDEAPFVNIPEKRNQFFSLFIEDVSGLERKEIPAALAETTLFQSAIEFGPYLNTIHGWDPKLNGLEIPIEEELELDDDIARLFGYEDRPDLIMLGWPQFMPDSALKAWKQSYLDISYHETLRDPSLKDKIDQLDKEFKSFIQLRILDAWFQIAEDSGDDGYLDIAYTEEELRSKNFEKLSFYITYS